MNNTFGITASFQIDGSMDGLSGGSGVFCGTVAGSGSHTKGSGSHTNNSVCSSSEVTPGKFVETLTHFGGRVKHLLELELQLLMVHLQRLKEF